MTRTTPDSSASSDDDSDSDSPLALVIGIIAACVVFVCNVCGFIAYRHKNENSRVLGALALARRATLGRDAQGRNGGGEARQTVCRRHTMNPHVLVHAYAIQDAVVISPSCGWWEYAVVIWRLTVCLNCDVWCTSGPQCYVQRTALHGGGGLHR